MVKFREGAPLFPSLCALRVRPLRRAHLAHAHLAIPASCLHSQSNEALARWATVRLPIGAAHIFLAEVGPAARTTSINRANQPRPMLTHGESAMVLDRTRAEGDLHTHHATCDIIDEIGYDIVASTAGSEQSMRRVRA